MEEFNQCDRCDDDLSALRVVRAVLITQCWGCGHRREYCLKTKRASEGYVDLEYSTQDLWTDCRWLFKNDAEALEE